MTKKYNIAFIIIIIIIIIIINLLSCNENLKLREKDIKKYDYLNPFLVSNAIKFEGTHNIDSEDFEFSYSVSNVQTTLSLIKEKANKEGWVTNFVDDNSISYSKKIKLFEGEATSVVVKVMVKDKSNRIYFVVN